MSYIILYFSIGIAVAIAVYLYSCYDYRVNWKNVSWDGYVESNDIYRVMYGIVFAYPLLLVVLLYLGLRWCIGYISKHIREYIFKIIDQYFVK